MARCVQNKALIVPREQAPDFMVYNDYIHDGYRVNHNSLSRLLFSLLTWHNETINTWTHLLGAILSTYTLFYLLIFSVTDRFKIGREYQYEFPLQLSTLPTFMDTRLIEVETIIESLKNSDQADALYY